MNLVTRHDDRGDRFLWIGQFERMQEEFDHLVSAFAQDLCSFSLKHNRSHEIESDVTVRFLADEQHQLWLEVWVPKTNANARLRCDELLHYRVMGDWVAHTMDVLLGFNFRAHRWRYC